MTDNVTVLPDTIEARTADPQVPDFDTNYIESGLVLSADFDAGLLAVSQGKCLHSYDGDLYYATKIERRTGDRRLSIPAGTSDVWYDFGAKEIIVGGDPGEPSLKIGGVDADAETVDGSINRERDITSGSLTTEAASIGNEVDARNYDGATGGERIQAAINDYGTDPVTVVVRGGVDDLSSITAAERDDGWLLPSEIVLPDNTALKFVGAYVFLEGGADSNLIRNQDFDAGNTNIHIHGDGESYLDGNSEGQDRYNTSSDTWQNMGIYLFNVSGFSMDGFAIRSNKWALVPDQCDTGRIHNIEFRQDGATPNEDGLHVKASEDIVATHLTGDTADDPLAVSTFRGESYGDGGDCRNIYMSNCTFEIVDLRGGLRTAPESGKVLESIVFDNISIRGIENPVIRLGFNGSGANYVGQPTIDEHRDITISNCNFNDTRSQALNFRSPTSDVTVHNINGTGREFIFGSKRVDNLTISDCNWTSSVTPFGMGTGAEYTNVTVTNSNFYVTDESSQAVNIFDGHSDITFRDCSFIKTTANRGGNGITIKDGATVSNIKIIGCTIEGFKYPAVAEANLTLNGPVRFRDTVVRDTNNPWTIVSDGVEANGVAPESADAEEPQLTHYNPGTVVDFTDTGDGSGTGVYKLVPDFDGGQASWTQIG